MGNMHTAKKRPEARICNRFTTINSTNINTQKRTTKQKRTTESRDRR